MTSVVEESSNKERKRGKVKKKILVKKPKGEKSSDPTKKDILGEDFDFKIICWQILHFESRSVSLKNCLK